MTDRVTKRTLRALALAFALTPLAGLLAADGPAGERLDFDRLFAADAGGRIPSRVSWSPNGDALAYRWREGEVDALWLATTGDTAPRRLLTVGAGGDPPRIDDLATYRWSPDGGTLLLVAGGDLFGLELADGELERLTATEAEETDPKFSPDGAHLAFVRDHNLFVIDLASGEERALTIDGAQNEILNATTDWVYWEEIWGRDSTGFWWSPKSDRIAYYRFDESPVASYPLVDATHPYPRVEWQKYPAAGERNPIVRVGVVALDDGETVWLDTGSDDDVYLARVDWRRSGDRVSVQRLDRDQERLDLLLCEPAAGACSLLLTETSETWVNLTRDLRFLSDDRFLWTSETSGWRQLSLHAADGAREADLTPADWTVTAVEAVAEDEESVVVTAYRRQSMGALHRSVLRLPLAGGAPEMLAGGEAWASVLAASADGRVALSTSTANRPASAVVVGPEGGFPLPSEPPAFDPEAVPSWEFITIPGPDGDRLPATLLRPADFDPERKYPAIMYHYGGPASQVVADRWGARGRGLWHKMMAQRGYAVLSVDNQASNFFGKSGANRAHRRFGEINLAAQRAGIDYLAGLGWVDVERVGIWGWSGGGTHTLYVLLNSPGTWAAGVSGAPVTDWRFYDSIWTERYLDHPEDNPDGYRDSSPVTYAAALADPLLLVHGTADDNVHPNNTFAMIRRLIDAGAVFDEAIHPGQKHGFRGGDSRHFYERMTRFFDRHLGGGDQALPSAGVAPAS